jgi:hypothetical protein
MVMNYWWMTYVADGLEQFRMRPMWDRCGRLYAWLSFDSRDNFTHCCISFGSCCTVLIKNLMMHHICWHVVLWMLMQEQCSDCMTVSGELTSTAGNNLDFIQKIVTGCEVRSFLCSLHCFCSQT